MEVEVEEDEVVVVVGWGLKGMSHIWTRGDRHGC